MTDEEALALVEGDVVEHLGYPGLRMRVLASPRPGWPDYVKPGPPVLVSFPVAGLVARKEPAVVHLSGAFLSRVPEGEVVRLPPLLALVPRDEEEEGPRGEVIPLFPDLEPEGA